MIYKILHFVFQKMFQVTFQDTGVVIITLTYKNVNISIIPESEDIIKTVDIENSKGKIGGEISKGEFSIYWDDEEIQICCAIYGDTTGGDVNISIPFTHETMGSLRSVLREWKKKVTR